MKKTIINPFIIIFLLVVSFLKIETAYSLNVNGFTLLGDANDNDIVDINDAKLIAKYVINSDIKDRILIDNSDYNYDNKIKINDIIMLLKLINNSSQTSNGLVAFIPTQPKTVTGNESILFKSPDGKLALLDTAQAGETNSIAREGKDNGICQKIEKYIHYYAGVDDDSQATLEYLIISHAHGDHVGCLSYFLEASKTINIKNIVMKNESLVTTATAFSLNESGKYTKYTNDANGGALYNYVNAKKQKTTKLITTNNLAENYILTLGSGPNPLKLHLYNLKDIYSDEDRCWTDSTKKTAASERSLGFSALNTTNSSRLLVFKGSNGGNIYPYLENANSKDITYIEESADSKINIKKYVCANNIICDKCDICDSNNNCNKCQRAYFYAFDREENKVTCSSNANSIAVLLEVPVGNNDMRYLYFPSDLENNGYSHNGLPYKDEDGKMVTLTSPGTNYFYEFDTKTDSFVFENGKLKPVSDEKIVLRPQEYKTSLKISKDIDTRKIVLYQISHHGHNADKESIDLLRINRKNMFAILTYFASCNEIRPHYHSRTCYNTLSEIPKIEETDETGYGIYYSGKYSNSENGKLEFSVQGDGSVRVTANE